MPSNHEEKQSVIIDLSNKIAQTKLILSEQFVPWSNGNIEGLYRKLLFSKNSLLGEVSQYFFEDYILWKYKYPDDYKKIQREWKGNSMTFLSRFVFLHPSLPFHYKRKAIGFGFRGYIDLAICPFPLPEADLNRKEIRDILFLLI